MAYNIVRDWTTIYSEKDYEKFFVNLEPDWELLRLDIWEALIQNTPKKTGMTSESWTVEIKKDKNGRKYLEIHNHNLTYDGMSIVKILENGRVTKSGKYVNGKYFVKKTIDEVLAKHGF